MTETIYRLPEWGETVLVICLSLMLATLAAWLFANSVCRMLDAESRLERKRRKSEAKALDDWQVLYEEEKQHRLEAISDLMDEIYDLRRENERMKQLLAKVKVADL